MYTETEPPNDLTPTHFFDAPKPLEQIFKAVSIQVQVSPITVTLNPHVLNDMLHFKEQLAIQQMLKDLKQYRPNRRPMTNVPSQLAQRFQLKRKRKLLVRDWFFFVVWYIRLRKILKGIY